jgi:FlaA1/EpsC-like NDP-sugar epimerase
MTDNSPEKAKSLTILLELVWWLLTVVVIFAVLFPIYKHLGFWKFTGWNILFIVVLITLSRYIFLLEHTFLAQKQRLKVILLLFMFPFGFTMIHGLNKFMNYIEEHSWEPITGGLPENTKHSLEGYMYGEMLFFGVGSVMVCAIFLVRMFKSVWTLHNRGKA